MSGSRAALAGLAALLSSCGGGGGGPADGTTPPPERADVALILVSGHAFSGVDPAYLRFDAGPEIIADLQGSGYSVAADYFVDDVSARSGFGGYVDLVAWMEFLRDHWVPLGTRVVVVAHSHGGVWAHEATRVVPDLPLVGVVDLDCSSFAWDVVGHDGASIGGDPRDKFDIGEVVSWPAYPTVPSEPGGLYDSEDVVFANVGNALEVRSGDSPFGGEWFDEKWSIRIDGTTTGITAHFSGTTHAEVHQSGGATLALVLAWVRSILGS